MHDKLVDAQRTDIPHTYTNIDISLYDREVIADKYSDRFLKQIKQHSKVKRVFD